MATEKDKFWSSFDDTSSTVHFSLALDRQKKYEKSEISAKVKYEKKIILQAFKIC